MGVVRCDSAGLVVVVMVFGFLIQTCYCDISVLCYVFLKCCCCSWCSWVFGSFLCVWFCEKGKNCGLGFSDLMAAATVLFFLGQCEKMTVYL